MRRILVTGSRYWVDRQTVWKALHDQYVLSTQVITVVHGGARGLDDIADRWAWGMMQEGWGVRVESHPANWKLHGKRAGVIRNQLMVDLGADVCLAFPQPDGTGTQHCMSRAAEAGIPVLNYGCAVPNLGRVA